MRLCSDYYSLFAYIRPPPTGGGQIGSNKYQLVIAGFAVPAIIGLSQTEVTEPPTKRAVLACQRVTVGFADVGFANIGIADRRISIALRLHVMLPCPSFCDVIRIYLPPFSSVTVSAV